MSKIETIISTAGCQVRNFAADQGGATAIEYALIASGIAVAIVATVFSLGSSVKGPYVKVDQAF